MRNIKELLIVLRDNEQSFKTGLCGLSWKLKISGGISFQENELLHKFIQENRPRWHSTYYSFYSEPGGFFWKKGEWAPRKRWLDSKIKKLK
jgi:hypothetical protein